MKRNYLMGKRSRDKKERKRKMKIDASKSLKRLDGVDITMGSGDESPFTIGKAIGLILSGPSATQKGRTPLKLYALASKFYNEAEVEIDVADLKLVTEEIESTQTYTPLVTGQILELLYSYKKEKE